MGAATLLPVALTTLRGACTVTGTQCRLQRIQSPYRTMRSE